MYGFAYTAKSYIRWHTERCEAETDARREESSVALAKCTSAGNPGFLLVTQELLNTFPAHLVRRSEFAERKETASQDKLNLRIPTVMKQIGNTKSKLDFSFNSANHYQTVKARKKYSQN